MLDDAHWPATSALIDDACGIKGSALVVGKGHSQSDGQIFFGKVLLPRSTATKTESGGTSTTTTPMTSACRVSRNCPTVAWFTSPDLYTEEELKTSLAYNEAFPRGGYQNGLNVRMDGPDGSHIVWTLADSTEPGGWGSAQTEMIEHLLPHIRQFVRVRQALAGVEALGASLTRLLDNTRVAVIHLDLQGRIATANDRARGILRQGDGLFDQGGFLAAWLPEDNARLKRLLAHALPTGGGQAVSGSMTVGRLPGLPRLAVHVSPRGCPSDGLRHPEGCRPGIGPRSGIPSRHRSGLGGVDTGTHAGGEPGGGLIGRRQVRTRHRRGDRPPGEFRPFSHQADTSQARHFTASGLGALGAVARRIFGLPALKTPSGRWTRSRLLA